MPDLERIRATLARVPNPVPLGLGLGLFIVQQIARAYGGDVDLVARDGRIVFRAVLQQ